MVYRTKPIFDAPGASEAMATDAQPETHSKPVSDAARKNDLSMTSPFLVYETFVVTPDESARALEQPAQKVDIGDKETGDPRRDA